MESKKLNGLYQIVLSDQGANCGCRFSGNQIPSPRAYFGRGSAMLLFYLFRMAGRGVVQIHTTSRHRKQIDIGFDWGAWKTGWGMLALPKGFKRFFMHAITLF